jgi:hypothetical protein
MDFATLSCRDELHTIGQSPRGDCGVETNTAKSHFALIFVVQIVYDVDYS